MSYSRDSNRWPFGLDETGFAGYRSAAEEAFLKALTAREAECAWTADGWPSATGVFITVTFMRRGVVFRTARVDFDGSGLAVGVDPTHASAAEVREVDPAARTFVGTPAELAAQAASFFDEEMRRWGAANSGVVGLGRPLV
jgi:hypothetical protein